MDVPKKSQLGSCLDKRDRATGGFSGDYNHRKPSKNIHWRGFAGFQILLLLRDSQPLREVRRISLGRKTRSAFFTPILASAYFTRSLRVFNVILREFYLPIVRVFPSDPPPR